MRAPTKVARGRRVAQPAHQGPPKERGVPSPRERGGAKRSAAGREERPRAVWRAPDRARRSGAEGPASGVAAAEREEARARETRRGGGAGGSPHKNGGVAATALPAISGGFPRRRARRPPRPWPREGDGDGSGLRAPRARGRDGQTATEGRRDALRERTRERRGKRSRGVGATRRGEGAGAPPRRKPQAPREQGDPSAARAKSTKNAGAAAWRGGAHRSPESAAA